MQQSWDSYCTLSIVHFMAFPECMGGEGPIVETLTKLAVDDFFGAVEVGWIKDPAVRREVRSIAEQSRLQLGFGAQSALLLGKLSLNDLDPEGRQKAVDQVKACIDEAAELGCKRVAFLAGPDPGDERRDEALDLLADSVLTLCRYARERGIALTLETFDRDIEKKSLVGPSDLAAAFAQRIRAEFPDFGLLYDLSHLPLLNETPLEALSQLKDFLVHIHVGNCVKVPGQPAYGDQHPRFGYPNGENDVPELVAFLRALLEIGYLRPGAEERPWVGFEVKPQAGESSELILANTKRAWRQAWAQL
ncbi:MAG: TIM barrel protein [Anaerolineae bacterium]